MSMHTPFRPYKLGLSSILLVLIILVVIQNQALGQSIIVKMAHKAKDGERPKIGLVLSGGGAKGLAHIGALKVLEEAGIHPDYIAGTSMGSIIGGLYALGFSVDSIEKIAMQMDWDHLLSNTLQMKDLNIEEKWNYNKSTLEFPIYHGKPTLPQGAIKGQQIELYLNKLTVSSAQYKSFDEFPIPFRAVAVDILKGEPYVFKDGSLALAMRASMSIPSVIDPIKLDSMLLVDGGLINNYPVRLCKEMGADIVIGIYTGFELLPEEKLNNMLNLLKQSALLESSKNALLDKEVVDIHIEPNLKNMNMAEFNRTKAFIAKGEKAASLLRDSLNTIASFMSQYPTEERDSTLLIDSVFVVGSSLDSQSDMKLFEQFFEQGLNTYNGKWVKTQEIKNNIDRLYGTRLFKKISYSLKDDSLGRGKIIAYHIVKENDAYLTLSGQYRTGSEFGLHLGLRYRNLIFMASKLEMKMKISEFPAFKFRYFSYLGNNTKNGLSGSYHLWSNNIFYYDDLKKTAIYKQWKQNAELRYYHYLGQNSSLSLSFGYQFTDFKTQIDLYNYLFKNITTNNLSGSISYKRNSLNDNSFPSRGSLMEMNLLYDFLIQTEYYFNEDSLINYPNIDGDISEKVPNAMSLQFKYSNFIPFGKRWVWENSLDFETDIISGGDFANAFTVGGISPENMDQHEFWGLPEYYDLFFDGLILRTGPRFEIIENLYVTVRGNLLLYPSYPYFLENNSNLQKYSFDFIYGGGLQFSYDSILGPLSFTLASSNAFPKLSYHLNLGFRF